MATIAEVKEARAAWLALEEAKCPFEEQGDQRSEWFKQHWPKKQAAEEVFNRKLGEYLAARGVRIKADGCGCCDSPHLTVVIDDELICDEGNWYFDNLLPKDGVEKEKAAADRLGGDV